jgi:ubiquinone/menaquinone biosynthesis C-methylase UbiE
MQTSWTLKGPRRRFVEKLRYESIVKHFSHLRALPFMNYGYLDPQETPLVLDPADEPNRLYAQLYERVARPVPLAGKDVLEVGSGRGGGASFLARRLKPRSYVGVDFMQGQVDLCREWHVVDGLSFRPGDAEHLPFEPAQFDVVMNVESSHGYGSMDRFLASVERVLRPGGHLLLADLRPLTELPVLRAQFQEAGLSIVEEQDITAFVLASLLSNAIPRFETMVREVPPDLHARFLEVGAFPGSRTFQSLATGSYRYLRFAVHKAP